MKSHPELCGKNPDLPGIPVKLSAPARRALSGAGLTTLKALSRKSRAELSGLHGMGPSAIKALEATLREQGLAFRGE